jgi:UDP-N-acetylmuramate dehydrogenase
MTAVLAAAGVEIRTEPFQQPPESAGGLCRVHGRNLVILDARASRAERSRALLEVVERIGLTSLGLSGSDLSPALLSALNRRGKMTWPHKKQAPPLAKATGEARKEPSPRLADLTTMGVGGRAKKFLEVVTNDELRDAARLARKEQLPQFPHGGGSNIVVSDEGIEGVVMKLAMTGIELTHLGEQVFVTAAAGENWHDFAALMTEEGFDGIECLGGIPGSVGATPIQNVGAYGQEVSQTIHSVRVLDRETLEIVQLPAEKCGFVYRGSIFKSTAKDRYVVLAVTYRLLRNSAPSVRYGELKQALGEQAPSASLPEVFRTVLALRKNKSMVLDPSDENFRSCGSFFVNAQIKPDLIAHIERVAGEVPPQFPGEDGLVKVPSAWLIEKAGLKKGTRAKACASFA